MKKTKLTRNPMNVTTRRGSRRRSRIGIPLLAYLALSLPVFGQEVKKLPAATDLRPHGVTQAQLNGLDTIMLKAIKQGKIKGCSYLVAHKGEIVYRKAHGAFKTDEQVLLASVSKPFAASVLMALVERGKVKLDDPVEKYLPEFKGIKVKGGQSFEKVAQDALFRRLGMSRTTYAPAVVRLCRNTKQLADFGNEHALAEFTIGTTQHRDNLVNTITFLRHLKILSGLRPGWILS